MQSGTGHAGKAFPVPVSVHCYVTGRARTAGWAGLHWGNRAVLVLLHVLALLSMRSTGWARVRGGRAAAASGGADRAILVLSHVLVTCRTGSTGWAGVRGGRAAAGMRGTRGSATGYGWVIVIFFVLLRWLASKHGKDDVRERKIK